MHKAIASDKRAARCLVPLLHDQGLPSRGDSTWLLVTPLMPYVGLVTAVKGERYHNRPYLPMMRSLLAYAQQLLEVRCKVCVCARLRCSL